MSDGKETKPVSAQQAIEDFLFEMLPAQSDLPEPLKSDVPEPLHPVKVRRSMASSVLKTPRKKRSPGAPPPELPMDPIPEQLNIAALRKLQSPEPDVAITSVPPVDLLTESLAAMDEIFHGRLMEKAREQERQEQERLEQKRLEQKRLEQKRLEQKRLEQERLEQERLEQKRLEQKRLEQERQEQERQEQERQEQERQEQERQEQERQEQERQEQERQEQERQEQERQEQERTDLIANDQTDRPSIAAQRHEARREQAVKLNVQEPVFRQPVSLEDKLMQARLASAFEAPSVAPPAEAKKAVPEEAPVAPVVEARVVVPEPPPPVAAPPEPEQEIACETEAVPPDPWLDCGRPQWADGNFQALLFTVAGLKMAVPLVCLGSIHPLIEDLTPLVGRAPWFMGLMPIHEQNMRVVDTALWVMPERYKEGIRDNYKYAINLADSDWALACDSVAQAITLSPDEVRWRTERSKRAWLAGTVVEHMCALVDVNMLRFQLQQQAQQRKRN